MFGMDEAGSKLRERVKSVLILVLAVGMLLLYTERETEKKNPIDTYFQELETKEGQELVRSHLYLDCWEQEFQYAYGLLTESKFTENEFKTDELSEAKYIKIYAEEAREKYWEYAEAFSWVEAYLGEKLNWETRKTVAKAAILKQQTLQIYEMLTDVEAATGKKVWDGSFYFELF